VPRYALIVEEDAGRAAGYARMVASEGLAAAVVSTADEGLSQVAKAGAPALVLLDHVVPQASGLDLLRGIRDILPGRQPPAVIVADSRESYRLATKESAALNVAAVLRRWQPRSALERALRGALSPSGKVDGVNGGTGAPLSADGDGVAEAGGRTAEVLPGHVAAPDPDPALQADALDLAERLAEHPLVERLARLRVPRADTADDLQRLVADTAEAFEAPMALIWLERAGRVRFAAHPRPGAGRSLRSSGGDWTALRDAFGETPLHVEDAGSHVFLAGNPLVTGGTIGCAAGAPLPGPGGRSIGTIALAAPVRGAIPRSLLDPLTFWAHRLVSELPIPGSAPEGARDRRRADRRSPSPGPASVLNEALGVGMMVSDARGTVTFANAALVDLLGLEGRKVIGMQRAAVVSSTGAPEDVLEPISGAQAPEPRRFTVGLGRTGEKRILRWQTRPVRVDGADGRLDEIVDVTREGEEIEARDDRVRIDALTGLANRRAGEEALAREIAAALRGGTPVSVALFEVQVPAAEAAERAFRQVSWLLRDALRGYDLVVRFAARRLLAILPHARGPQAAALAERFRAAVGRAAKQVAGATLTYGVAEFERAQDVERLLAQATTALDAANAKARRLPGREDA
jgi:diguanylate cyclase (GGDEF)-like protein